jgi:ABC-type transport system involved in cytochrome c biogenesis permease subunit
MLPQVLFFLAGLTALAFLTVVWRRRQMPALLRAILIIVTAAVVLFVAWSFLAPFTH